MIDVIDLRMSSLILHPYSRKGNPLLCEYTCISFKLSETLTDNAYFALSLCQKLTVQALPPLMMFALLIKCSHPSC